MAFLAKFKAMLDNTRHFVLCEDVRKYVEKRYDPNSPAPDISPKEQKRLEAVFYASYDELIAKKGLTDDEIRQRVDINKNILEKTRAHSLIPVKKTLLLLSMALGLDINDTEWLLQSAGYDFSKADKAELTVRFFIEHKFYDIKVLYEVFESLGYKLV